MSNLRNKECLSLIRSANVLGLPSSTCTIPIERTTGLSVVPIDSKSKKNRVDPYKIKRFCERESNKPRLRLAAPGLAKSFH